MSQAGASAVTRADDGVQAGGWGPLHTASALALAGLLALAPSGALRLDAGLSSSPETLGGGIPLLGLLAFVGASAVWRWWRGRAAGAAEPGGVGLGGATLLRPALAWFPFAATILAVALAGRLVTLLGPRVYDGLLYRMDLALVGGLASVGLQRVLPRLASFGHLQTVATAVLVALPLGAAALLRAAGLHLRFVELRRAFCAVGALTILVQLAVPAVGPRLHYGFMHAEGRARLLDRVGDADMVAERIDAQVARAAPPQRHRSAAPRHSLPSLPAAWGLLGLLALVARPGSHGAQRRRWRAVVAAAGGLLGVGLVALLTAGQVYVVSLLAAGAIAAAAFSVGVSGRGRRWVTPAGLAPLGAGALLLAALALLGGLRALTPWTVWPAWLLPGGALVWLTVQACRRQKRAPGDEGARGEEPAAALEPPHSTTPGARAAELGQGGLLAVLALFFLSGFTGLLYEVVFEKDLALIFGSTARSATTVLATYMAGLAIGARLGGGLADRVRRPLRAYALAEWGVGAACLLAPAGFALAQWLYPLLAAGAPVGSPAVAALRITCGAAVLLLPALLMGTTMPLLVRHVTRRLGDAEGRVAALYAANTLGAALGTVVTAYVILPWLGRSNSIYLATTVNFAVSGAALWLSLRTESRADGTKEDATDTKMPPPPSPARERGGQGGVRSAQARPEQPGAPPAPQAPVSWLRPGALGWLIAVLALVAGVVTFGLEVAYIHLLAVVVGNSAYAFALMLFVFLLGLGLGGALIARWRVRPGLALLRLALTQVALAAVVLLSLGLWDLVPGFFSAYSGSELARGFGERELIRAAVCLLLLLGPTLLIGLSFPQLVSIASSDLKRLGRTVGRVSAFNTAGNILGAVVVGFAVLSWLGSYRTVVALACCSLGVGTVAALAAPGARSRWTGGVAALAVAALAVALPGSFRMERLTTGANVYFAGHPYGEVVEHLESVEGGLTSIHRRAVRGGRTITTLLTNGKFQGDDGPELPTQHMLALYPLLHQARRERALVIGLGTGVTAGTLLAAGFGELHAAELSADIATMAERHFGRVSHDVLRAPQTHLHLTDGRNLLLLDERPYDLISIEVSSVWFAGAASIYSADFYALAARRLGEHGVLQQWVQVHHIDERDLAAIFAAARLSFPYLYFYFSGLQGALVCSRSPSPPTLESLQALEEPRALAGARRLLPRGSALPLLGQLVLDPGGVERFLDWAGEQYGQPWQELASDDDNMFLEYSTPRGNVRAYGASTRQNLTKLRAFQGAPTIGGETRPGDTKLIDAVGRLGRGEKPAWPAPDPRATPWLRRAARRLGAP